jgi:hypothetical protein
LLIFSVLTLFLAVIGWKKVKQHHPPPAQPSTRSFDRAPIKAPPGWRLRDWAETVFSRKTYTTILEPILRDLLDDYCKALKEGRPSKARFVCLRGYWSFWAAVLAQLPISALKVVFQIWKAIP